MGLSRRTAGIVPLDCVGLPKHALHRLKKGGCGILRHIKAPGGHPFVVEFDIRRRLCRRRGRAREWSMPLKLAPRENKWGRFDLRIQLGQGGGPLLSILEKEFANPCPKRARHLCLLLGGSTITALYQQGQQCQQGQPGQQG